jgi:hypothetical protein
MKKLTHVEFVDRVYTTVGNEYIVKGIYEGARKHISLVHILCGTEWETMPSNFLNGGNRCPICSRIKASSKSKKNFNKDVFNLVGDEYSVLGNYINRHTKILMKHHVCGYEWKILPNNFINGQRCPRCNNSLKYTTLSFKKKVFDLVGNEYVVLSEYSPNKVQMKHNTKDCGYEWHIRPSSFVSQGTRCPFCSIRKSSEDYSKQLDERYDGEYILNSKYISNKKKVSIKHISCGTEFEVYPNDLLDGDTSCPNCNDPKNERRIRLCLLENNIKFIPQMKFEGLIGLGGGKLSYDFYLPNKNILIEYQGEFHDGKANDFVAKNLEYQKEHDRRKRENAKLNNINLIEIWYWDKENIENILNEKLNFGN